MLLYQPAFDTYHSLFRMMQLVLCDESKRFEIDRLRILDFYLLFPQELNRFTFTRDLFSHRKLGKSLSGHYGRLQNPHRIFHQLESLQISALYSLAAYDLVDAEQLKTKRLVVRTDAQIPELFEKRVHFRIESQRELVELLVIHFDGIPLHGPGGLKDRSGLLEYRNDIT